MERAGSASGEPIRRVSYRSDATRRLDSDEIADLVEDAAARNAASSITGALVSSGDRYRQWIEGSPAAIEALLDALRRDARHKRLTVTEDVMTDARAFVGWHMQLFQGVQDAALAPQAIALGRVAPALATEDWAGALASPAAARDALRKTPELTASQAAAVAAALAAPEDDGALAHALRPFMATAAGRAACYEAVAQALGDGWMADRWSMTDATLALGRFQALLWQARPAPDPVRPMAHAIVANQPGNPHFLGAVIKADVLRATGWAVSLMLDSRPSQIEGAARRCPGTPLVLSGSHLLSGVSEGPLADLSAGLRRAFPGTPVLVGHRGGLPLAATAQRLRATVAAALRPGLESLAPCRSAGAGALPLT
ncbi:BLUF domain-containing protein [Rhodosalinus sp.]|uniref:BLUF domain-containing protein n=1 Tax=Rhodosalinus sp. TaxID=2047741 RepID=UPI003568C02A